MASLRKQLRTAASASDVWDVVRDLGALHTRLVPGFVTDTKVEGDARVVTFANGVTVTEPIVAVDDGQRRLVWTLAGTELVSHYNGALEVLELPDGGTEVVWTADFLPHGAGETVESMMEAGMAAMGPALDRLAT